MPAHTAKTARARRTAKPARIVAAQLDLELPPEGTFDQRIQWARSTAGNYEEMAARETDPALRARLEKRAAKWVRRMEDLIGERRRRDAQPEFF